MVGSKKEKEAEEGSGKVSEVWRSMSLEDLEPTPESEPGEQQSREGEERRGESSSSVDLDLLRYKQPSDASTSKTSPFFPFISLR
jgi:hypothetical protein